MRIYLHLLSAVILVLTLQETLSKGSKNDGVQKLSCGNKGGSGGNGGGNVIICMYYFHRCTMHGLLGKNIKPPKKQVMCLLNSQSMQCVGEEFKASGRRRGTITINPIC